MAENSTAVQVRNIINSGKNSRRDTDTKTGRGWYATFFHISSPLIAILALFATISLTVRQVRDQSMAARAQAKLQHDQHEFNQKQAQALQKQYRLLETQLRRQAALDFYARRDKLVSTLYDTVKCPAGEDGDCHASSVEVRALAAIRLVQIESKVRMSSEEWAGVFVAPSTNLRRVDLQHAPLHRANLEGVDFSQGHLGWADLSYASLSSADFGLADLSGANLRGARMSGADLSFATVNNANLSRTDLKGAKLSGASLSGTNLHGADLRRADVGTGAVYSGKDAEESHHFSASLKNADLSNARLEGVDFTGADLTGADLEGARLDPDTKITRTQLESAINVPESAWTP